MRKLTIEHLCEVKEKRNMNLHEYRECEYESSQNKRKILQDGCFNNDTEKASSYGEDSILYTETNEYRSEIASDRHSTDDSRSRLEDTASNRIREGVKRTSYADVRTSYIRSPKSASRLKTCTKGSAPKKAVIFGCNSTRGSNNYDTINQRCIKLYDAAMRKIKIENDRKTKILKDEERSSGLVGTYTPKNMVHCKKLYELNKEKNAIGKKRREEIKTRISKTNPRPLGRSTTSVSKKSRRSERAIQGQPLKTINGSIGGALRQSLRNTTRYNRSTLQCERAILTLERTLEIDRDVDEKKMFKKEKTKHASPRFLHLYESGKRKIRTQKKNEGQGPVPPESSTVCKISGTNTRCKKLYQLSKTAQNFGRQRREEIRTAAAAKAKNKGCFRLRT